MDHGERIVKARKEAQARLIKKIEEGTINAGELGGDVREIDFLKALEDVLQGAEEDQ